jgi:protein required for attachment to host cells
MTAQTTWVLVANGSSAQVYVFAIKGSRLLKELVPISNLQWHAEPKEIYEVGRNATGMVFQSMGGGVSMSEPHIDVRKEIKQHLATTIAKQINSSKVNKQFDQLILVVPPEMLGELRAHLSSSVRNSIKKEVTKDLRKCSSNELLEHLQEVV